MQKRERTLDISLFEECQREREKDREDVSSSPDLETVEFQGQSSKPGQRAQWWWWWWWCARDQVFQKLLSFGGAAPAPASSVPASRQPVSPCCQLEIWPRFGQILTPSKDALNSAANLLSHQSPPTRGERGVCRLQAAGCRVILSHLQSEESMIFPSTLSPRGQPGRLQPQLQD